MRNVPLALLFAVSLMVAAAYPGRRDPVGVRTTARGEISVIVPAGWHVVRGWLSYVVDPVPRLAVASFPVRLSRHTCECGMPNVEHFPRSGVFLFMWERLRVSRRALGQFPRRPAHFRVNSGAVPPYVCGGPSDGIVFREAGRLFQADIYVGPAAGGRLRALLLGMMNSLRVGG